MDKDLLRIIIIGIGLVIIIAMMVWGYFRNQNLRNDMSMFRDDPADRLNSEDDAAPDFSGYAFDDEKVPLGKIRNDHSKSYDPNLEPMASEPRFPAVEKAFFDSSQGTEAETQPPPTTQEKAQQAPVAKQQPSKQGIPPVIQLSIISKHEEGFNGLDLEQVFDLVGLEYGSMKIYERLDINRLVDFGVASMVNPGTFPLNDMANFHTPGITFFMQPNALPDSVLVFDDMVRTINLIAKELDGIKWDAERKPLNEFTLKLLRKSLQA